MKTDEIDEEPWVKELQLFVSRAPGVLIRLRGLPYDCSSLQVVDFFRRGEHPSDVLDGEHGVFFVKKLDGKATGDAFVMMRNEAAATAALTKHKALIGTRYIELFRVATADVEQVVRRTLEAKSKPPAPRPTPQLQAPAVPPQVIPCGPMRDCIRLRGLPYEAQVHHLLDFLGLHAKNIVFQGVHMVYDHSGHPTGEAFVQMSSETAASLAAAQCHNGYMMAFGKKQRYVEVFQCSGEDMSAFLSGAAPPLPSPGVSEVLPPFLPVFPPPLLEPRCQLGPGLPPGTPSPPVVYFLVNPNERFFSMPPHPEWLPEYPPSSMLGQSPLLQQPDYIVS